MLQTQIAITKVKDFFQTELAAALNLYRVTARYSSCRKADLTITSTVWKRTVSFTLKDMAEKNVEIVQSLAKWKRMALGRYGIECGKGIYTDMDAIRRDEDFDNLHSVYVDQWTGRR